MLDWMHQDARIVPMRTTVTLADDVAAEVERLRRERSLGLSQALNELARAGMNRAPKRAGRFVQRTHDFGGSFIDVTNVAEALDQLEGPGHRG
jgi:hypothetical protein